MQGPGTRNSSRVTPDATSDPLRKKIAATGTRLVAHSSTCKTDKFADCELDAATAGGGGGGGGGAAAVEHKLQSNESLSGPQIFSLPKGIRRASVLPPSVLRQPTMVSRGLQQHNKVIHLLAQSADLHSSIHHGVADHQHPAVRGSGQGTSADPQGALTNGGRKKSGNAESTGSNNRGPPSRLTATQLAEHVAKMEKKQSFSRKAEVYGKSRSKSKSRKKRRQSVFEGGGMFAQFAGETRQTRRPSSATSKGSAHALEAEVSERAMLEALEADIEEAIELAALSRSTTSTDGAGLSPSAKALFQARSKVRDIVESHAMQHVVTALVVLNAVLIGIETDYGPSGYHCPSGAQGFGCSPTDMEWAFILDNVIVAVFNVEILLKLFGHGGYFFKDAWNVFDFAVILLSDVDLVLGTVPGVDVAAGISALRLLRVVRIFRLLKSVPELQELTEAFLSSAPGVMWVGVLLVLMFMVYAVIATVTFGLNSGTVTQQAAYTEWFGTIGESMYSLFQIMTLESWSMGIVREVMKEWQYSWIFFVSWILLSSYGILNLLASIFVEKILEAKEKTEESKKEDAVIEKRASSALLHQTFFRLIKSRDEGLTLDELRAGVQSEEVFRTLLLDTGWLKDGPQAVATLFEILDINGDGVVSFEEFLNIALSTNDGLTKEDVLKQRLHIKSRLDDLFIDIDHLNGNITNMFSEDAPSKDGKSNTHAQTKETKKPTPDAATRTDSTKQIETSNNSSGASSILNNVVASSIADYSREEVIEACKRASVLPLHDFDADNLTKSEFQQLLEQKARRTLLWWSH